MNPKSQKIINIIRDFLFRFVNKEFLIFLCFLALSAGFWLITALNETYEREIPIPVKLTGIPNNVIITDGLPDTVKVSVRDKGYALLTYYYSDIITPVKVPFSNYAKNVGHGQISQADFIKMVNTMLFASTKVTSVKSDKLEFFFSYGISKRVPILYDGMAKPAETYYISRIAVLPDSATVYASKEILDKIREVYTDLGDLTNIKDTTITHIPLKKIRGAKIVPSEASIRFFCDILTEKTISVPITCPNMEKGFVLRTFPASVSVKVIIGKSNLASVVPENFSVIVDYAEVKNHPTDKCSLKLAKTPRGITSATLETQKVDYLIETLE